MILTGRRLPADEALATAWSTGWSRPGTALEGARALAAEILEGSPTSVRVSLRIMEETRGIPDVVDAVTHPSAALDDLMASDDAIEGMTAFAQKRRPAGATANHRAPDAAYANPDSASDRITHHTSLPSHDR